MTSPFGGNLKLRAADLANYLTKSRVDADAGYQNADGTITATSYSNALSGGTPCFTICRAKASGLILFGNACVIKNSTTGRSLVSYQIRHGPTMAVGTVIQSPLDTNALYVIGTEERTCCRIELISGFTPGEYYNFQQHYRVSSGTGTFNHMSMFALPL